MNKEQQAAEEQTALDAEMLSEMIIKQHPKAIDAKPILLDMCKLLSQQENRIVELESEALKLRGS